MGVLTLSKSKVQFRNSGVCSRRVFGRTHSLNLQRGFVEEYTGGTTRLWIVIATLGVRPK